jgi:putative ABC transport system permease protein
VNIFWQDLRYGARTLLKTPGFTLVAVITLALGIGANTAIFSVVNSLLLESLPYQDAGRLVWIWGTNAKNGIAEETASPPDFLDWKTSSQSFEGMAAFSRTAGIFTDRGEPERVLGAAVTDGFFSLLGARALKGRTFVAEEDKPGAEPVIILSEGFWQRRFGADPDICGKSVTFNGEPAVVVGVIEAGFLNPRPDDRQPVEFWRPFRLNYSQINRRSDYLGVIARLKPRVTIAQAHAEMVTIASRLEQQYPATNTGWSTKVISLHERFFGDVSRALIFLMCAVGFLLLIACANVANLLLVRATSRSREMAIRAALGATRGRAIRQLLTESVLLSLLGGAAGLVIAVWGVEMILSIIPNTVPRVDVISLDSRALIFTAVASLATGIAFGLVPAIQASRLRLSDSLKEGARSGLTPGGNRIRNILAVAEIALALVLLVGAGLMVRSFINLQNVDPGFNPDRVLTMQVQLPAARYKGDPQIAAFGEQLLERVNTLPGIESAGLMSDVPLAGGGDYLGFAIEGRAQNPDDPNPDAIAHAATPGYFKTMGIQLKSGRLFGETDHREAPPVIVINEAMARRFWNDEDPLGKRINLGAGQNAPWLTIIGVVGSVRHETLSQQPYPEMYAPIAQQPTRVLNVVVRSAADNATVVSSIREQVKQLDQDLPVFNTRTAHQLLADSMARPRFNALLVTLFAAVALILASIGIYGVISYGVSQREHEIGVRVALGAGRSDIIRMVIVQGLRLVAAGIAIGLITMIGLSRLMEGLLFEVSETDLLTFTAVPLLLAGVVLLACCAPALRATRVDPINALRYE